MNANPSGSRTPSTGSRGESEARREFAGCRGTVVRPCTSRRRDREYPAGAIGGRDWLKRRDAARQDGVSRGPRHEARRPRKGRGRLELPGMSPFISCHICFFWRTRPLTRTRSVHTFPTGARPGFAKAGRRARTLASRQSGPTSERLLASSTRRVTPSWSDARYDVTSTSACAAIPRERSPGGMTIASLLLAFLSVAGVPASRVEFRSRPARFPRRMVRPLPQGHAGCRPVDPRRVIRSRRSTSTRNPIFSGATASRAFPRSSWSTAPARELDRISGPRVGEPNWHGFTRRPPPRPADPSKLGSHVGRRGDRRSATMTTKTTMQIASNQERPAARGRAARRRRRRPDRPAPAFTNPKPWETVVRIRVIGNRSTGFGSGTVIHSTPEESLILTCAHIFKIDGRQARRHPSNFRGGS